MVNRENVKRFWPWRTVEISILLAFLAALLATTRIVAQETEGRLVISSTDNSSAPTILLRAYGMDAQGNPLELDPSSLTIQHAGQSVSEVELVGQYQAGTFTILVVDIPQGVESYVPTISEAMGNFATPQFFAEQVDYVMVFQVGSNSAAQLLEPTTFYNGVRNFLDKPLELESGPTALIDSLVGLLTDASTLKPKQDMLASIVLFSDGTDVVSTRFDPGEPGPLAAQLGVPIHTVWLENQNLPVEGQEEGRGYLAQLSRESRGLAARINQPAEVAAIWDRISRFRNHVTIQYRPPLLIAGEHDVILSLRSDPAIQASATIDIVESSPTVEVNLPPEDRQLSIESLDSPVRLTLSTKVGWLDEVERQLAEAQLLVNGNAVYDIDVEDVEKFTVDIDNFNYGPNTIQIVVTDELGQRATSPELTLTIQEGETDIPETIEPAESIGITILRTVAICFGALFVVVLLVFVLSFIARRRGARTAQTKSIYDRISKSTSRFKRRSGRRPRRREATEEATIEDEEPQTTSGPVGSTVHYLEILESVTRMPQYIELSASEHLVGRSPAQTDIVFENDITVSRVHASIIREGSDYRIYDADSSSGTWVNDQPMPDYGHQLVDGDEIRIGDARMVYRRG